MNLYVVNYNNTVIVTNDSICLFLLGVDYNVSDVFVLQPEDERVAVPITIFEDALPEQQEYFQLRIRPSPNFLRRTPRSVFLSITDNDRKTICHVLNSMDYLF